MSIGGRSAYTPPIQRFDGKITDFRFYDTALTRGEVEHLYRGLHKNIDSLIKPALHLPLNSSNPASNVLTTAGNKLKHSISFELINQFHIMKGNSTVELHSNSFLKGSTADGMRFPSGSIPSNFTMATVARHPVGGEDGRIFDATTSNWTHGFTNNVVGGAYYDGWKTDHTVDRGIPDGQWVIFGGQNRPANNAITINSSTSSGYTHTGNYEPPITISFWFKFKGTSCTRGHMYLLIMKALLIVRNILYNE